MGVLDPNRTPPIALGKSPLLPLAGVARFFGASDLSLQILVAACRSVSCQCQYHLSLYVRSATNNLYQICSTRHPLSISKYGMTSDTTSIPIASQPIPSVPDFKNIPTAQWVHVSLFLQSAGGRSSCSPDCQYTKWEQCPYMLSKLTRFSSGVCPGAYHFETESSCCPAHE